MRCSPSPIAVVGSLALALLVAACSSEVTTPDEAGGTTGAGTTTASTTGSGGAAGTSTSVGAGGAPPTGCGGVGAPCDSDTYRAVGLFTNVPRFALLKASPARNLCFRMTVAASMGVGIGIHGGGFAVELAEVTHDASDCNAVAGPLPPPKGASHPVASGSGALAFTAAPGGCTAGIHAKAALSGEPPWAPPSEPLDADNLMIEGGCP